MLSLSPAKLLVILVIGVIVLGPEKLPSVARQLGAAWGEIRRWRTRLENEVKGAFPDLPTHEMAQAVRSPLAFLDRLADEHERAENPESAKDKATSPPKAPDPGASNNGTPSDGPSANGVSSNGASANVASANGGAAGGSTGSADLTRWRSSAGGELADDPSMN